MISYTRGEISIIFCGHSRTLWEQDATYLAAYETMHRREGIVGTYIWVTHLRVNAKTAGIVSEQTPWARSVELGITADLVEEFTRRARQHGEVYGGEKLGQWAAGRRI